jgi:hypothetical protein
MQPQSTPQSAPPSTSPDRSALAIGSLILGIVGLCAWLLPLCGLPVSLAAVILGALSLKSSRRGMAIAGLILGVLALLLAIGNAAFGAYLGATGELFNLQNLQ